MTRWKEVETSERAIVLSVVDLWWDIGVGVSFVWVVALDGIGGVTWYTRGRQSVGQ